MDTSSAPDLHDYADLLRRRWAVVGGGVLAGLSAAALGLAVAPESYTATTAVQVRPTGLAELTGERAGRTNGEVNLDTEAQIVRSARVATAAAELLGSGVSATELRERVEVTVPPNSSVLEIGYRAADPEDARRGAEAFADAYLTYRADQVGAQIDVRLAALQEEADARYEELAGLADDASRGSGAARMRAQARLDAVQNEVSDLNGDINPLRALRDSVVPGQVITPATAPESPTAPVPLLWLGGGAMTGLLLGLGTAYLLDRGDSRLHTARDVRRAADAPLLLDTAAGPVPAAGAAEQRANEAAHTLEARLGDGRRVLLVPGVTPGRAGAVAAVDLAAAFTRIGADVLLVCADPDDSAVRGLLGLSAGPGLAEALAGDAPEALECRSPRVPGLRVLRHGRGDASALLQQRVMTDLLRRLRGTARYVVVATAPASARADAAAMAAEADAVLPAVELGVTRRSDLADTTARLAAVGARVPGLAAVAIPPAEPPAP
ncbi:hypothetical protein, partial [Nocardiopsis trehalosi]|uniref:hypothetical protein n=1 Tax=Nocardiopsis trehalosi TaxID=109329 RepID=UPI000833E070